MHTSPRHTSRAAAAAALLSVALLAAACGSDAPQGGTPDAEPTSGGGSGTATPSSSGAFPVTVDTAFGEVEIPEEPQRVVALGWSDAETALALGVEPVGASDWLGFGGDGVGPWSEGYTTSPEIIGTLEPELEAIAALQPDLILDTRSDGTQERYDALSRIATTVGIPEGAGAYTTTWEDQLELVGEALGREDEADALEDEVEQTIEDAAAANPQFDGTTVAVGARTSEGYSAYTEGDTRVDLMESLGFEQSERVQELAGDGFSVPVSSEQLELLDADLTVVFPIFVEASEITDDPLFQALPSVQDGRSVVLEDETLLNAFSSGSAPGITYAVENAFPLFAAAVPAR
ncbi:iron-siderophore ABC transporter substrate-binding protein [uncultured Pseudokineococcus sp.]|uniref:iron-siderophore ABC transporter substrate-binding protein n=1 Tax=uncultured Pseudokineococcus sp. TaxID=1642928 RepID=UPI00261A001F|nr:iron-siderophore ABC transporter substrate-binding protein [uncultured Pseudokineococcus sp.]